MTGESRPAVGGQVAGTQQQSNATQEGQQLLQQETQTQSACSSNDTKMGNVPELEGNKGQDQKQRDGMEEDKENGSGAENEVGNNSVLDDDDADRRLQNDIQAQIEGEEQDQQKQQRLQHEERPAPESVSANHTNATAASSQPQSQQQAPQDTSSASLNLVPPELDRFSIHDVPPNIARIRQLLFELREPIEMSLDEFALYWPFIDNIWVKHRPQSTRNGIYVTDYYMCRLRRPTCKSKQQKTPPTDGKKPRAKAVREGGTCNFQMKVVKFEGAVTTITISRTPGSSPTHSHDLDHMDNVKRNSGLMGVIWKEAEKAYLPASIFAKLREDPVRLAAIGGKYMRASDVRNVCAKWRAMHPNIPLRTHAGYQLAHGLGVMKVEGPQSAITVGSQPAPTPSVMAPDALPFPSYSLDFLEPYLPKDEGYRKYPHVTLTYASSMDAKISLMPGVQTHLSCHETKLMTHYLRSRHDAVLIGLRTALADDPGLNCRLDGAGGYGGLGRMWQPRPVIIDPTGKWPCDPESRILRTAKEGKGKAPWVVVSPGAVVPPDKLTLLKSYGGDFLRIVDYNAFWRLRWEAILAALAAEGIRSVMIEGGGTVISELLNPEYTDFIDSLIVTVVPSFLGRRGVGVAPDPKYDENGKPRTAMAPREVRWQPLGQDVVMCGKIRVPPPPPPHSVPLPQVPVQQQSQAPPILEGIEAIASGNFK
ncbi:hypothetical protein VTO42DRAFT_8604 [Malbranchea cinnamomea]